MINKKFVLRTDAAAMNKVLNKEVKNASEPKFARWKALFSNFEFDIEHIKGSKNCLSDFLAKKISYRMKKNRYQVSLPPI